jgi:hypothetical protein
MNDINDDFLQFLLNRLHEGYSEYKKNHPDFAKVVEEQLEGKTDAEFEAQFEKKKPTHCFGCGEWLEGMDQCGSCGRINKYFF